MTYFLFYVGLLHVDAKFLSDWLGVSLTHHVHRMITAWCHDRNKHKIKDKVVVATNTAIIDDSSCGEHIRPFQSCIHLVDMLNMYVRPLVEGHDSIFSPHAMPFDGFVQGLHGCLQHFVTINPSLTCDMLVHSLDQRLESMKNVTTDSLITDHNTNDTIVTEDATTKDITEDTFERILVTAIGQVVKKGDIDGLKLALEVASASLPTEPKNTRCIRSPLRLASMVVLACVIFGEPIENDHLTTISNNEIHRRDAAEGLSLMWQLIETTPTSLAEYDDGSRDSEKLSVQLDAIQAALTICEIVQYYLPCPPLAMLLPPSSSQHKASNSSSSLRLSTRNYVRHLLSGCGFLVAGLEDIFQSSPSSSPSSSSSSSSSSSNGATLEQESMKSAYSSVDLLTNTISFGQAIILRVCYEFGVLQQGRGLQSDHVGVTPTGVSMQEANKGWTGLAQDVAHLCAYFADQHQQQLEVCDDDDDHGEHEAYALSTWSGNVLLQSMIHFVGVNQDFVAALETILNETVSENSDGISDGLETTHTALLSGGDGLGELLRGLGVTSQHVERLVLKRATEIFNSISSCCDVQGTSDLREVHRLLNLLPPHANPDVAREVALLDLVELLATLHIDLLPLQLRLMSPPDIAIKILEQRPQAYYEVDGKNDFDELYTNIGTESGNHHQDALLKRAMLRDRPPPGARLVRVLSALQPLSASITSPVNTVSSTSTVSSQAQVRLALLNAAIDVGDIEGAYRLCRALLAIPQHSLVSSLQTRIIDTSLVVTALLESSSSIPSFNPTTHISHNSAYTSGSIPSFDLNNTTEHHCELRRDLLSAIFAAVPSHRLEHCSNLWRTPGSEQSIPLRKNTNSNFSSSHIPSSNTEGVDLTEEMDCHLSAARDALLAVIANELYGGVEAVTRGFFDDHFSSNNNGINVVTGMASKNSRISEAMGFLLLVATPTSVDNLITTLYNDLDRKLSIALQKGKKDAFRQSGATAGMATATLDENLVTKLMAKGFSRNGAKRSVLASKGDSLEAAFRWAVEHSLDEDFEHPGRWLCYIYSYSHLFLYIPSSTSLLLHPSLYFFPSYILIPFSLCHVYHHF